MSMSNFVIVPITLLVMIWRHCDAKCDWENNVNISVALGRTANRTRYLLTHEWTNMIISSANHNTLKLIDQSLIYLIPSKGTSVQLQHILARQMTLDLNKYTNNSDRVIVLHLLWNILGNDQWRFVRFLERCLNIKPHRFNYCCTFCKAVICEMVIGPVRVSLFVIGKEWPVVNTS